jgi:hypothetical protein
MSQGLAVIIKADGFKEVVIFEIGAYKYISEAVGGMFDCVGISKNEDMYCNDNAIAEGLPLNLFASAIYSEAFGAGNPILGDVIITGGVDDEGETLGLTDELVTKWLNYSKQVIPSAYLTNPLYQ